MNCIHHSHLYVGNNRFNLFIFSTPAYDWAPNPDKQWILQVTDRMEPIHKKFTDLLMTKRLQTLQSIDEGIEKVKLILLFDLFASVKFCYFISGHSLTMWTEIWTYLTPSRPPPFVDHFTS